MTATAISSIPSGGNANALGITKGGAGAYMVDQNTTSAKYSIVVDFVTPKGDTVVDTKVVKVGPVQPRATAHWSSTGGAGAGSVVCVIRQALARS